MRYKSLAEAFSAVKEKTMTDELKDREGGEDGDGPITVPPPPPPPPPGTPGQPKKD